MKLQLIKFGPQDFDDYFRLVSERRVMAMITERPIPEEEALVDFNNLMENNAIHPALGQFKIVDPLSGQFLGLAKLEIASAGEDTAELGYMLLPEFWGRGIAGQVAKQLIDIAERQPAIENLIAIIDPANLPSRKILLNNQFISREFKDFDGLPGEVLGRAC